MPQDVVMSPAASSSDGDEDDDEVVHEIPVFLNRMQDPPDFTGEMYLLQYPLRPVYRPYGDQGFLERVELRDDQKKLRLRYKLNDDSETFDQTATHSSMREQVLMAKTVTNKSCTYCVGAVNSGQLTLTPLASFCQLRPDFTHVDKDRQERQAMAAKIRGKQAADNEEKSLMEPVKASSKKSQVISASTSLARGATSMGAKQRYQQSLLTALRQDHSLGAKPEGNGDEKEGEEGKDRAEDEGGPWKELDFYDADSPEAADIYERQFLTPVVSESAKQWEDIDARAKRERRTMELKFHVKDQDSYLTSLCGNVVGVKDEWGDLGRLDVNQQLETIMKKLSVANYSKQIVNLLPVNTRHNLADNAIISHLENCSVLVRGVWVLSSRLTNHAPKYHDLRDLVLLLLSTKRPFGVEHLKAATGFTDMEIAEVLKPICVFNSSTRSLQLRIPYDDEFGKEHPEVTQRQHDQAEARLMELRTKWKKEKEMQQSGSSSPSSPSSANTLKLTSNAIDKVKERIGKAVANVTEIRKLLQTLYPQDIVTDANALDAIKQAGGMKLRDKWILTSTGHKEIDTYRSVLMAIYRIKDSATKKEITDEFERVSGKKCTLTDHAVRRLIKEFADLKSGRWVFRGETLEELREQAGVNEGGATSSGSNKGKAGGSMMGGGIKVIPLFSQVVVNMKIAVLGPRRAGKSAIANTLAEVAGALSNEYSPTTAVRILEFETDDGGEFGPRFAERAELKLQCAVVRGFHLSDQVAVELWDVSGSAEDFEKCYRAIQMDWDGVILVYDPNDRNQVKEIDAFWYKKHVKKQLGGEGDGGGNSRCMVIQTPRLELDEGQMKQVQAVPGSMERIGTITNITSLEDLDTEQLPPTRAMCGPAEEDTIAEEVFSSAKESMSAAASVNSTLPRRGYVSAQSSVAPAAAMTPQNTMASFYEGPDPNLSIRVMSTPGVKANVPENGPSKHNKHPLPPTAPLCKMVIVKLSKSIEGDKFGFVNQPPPPGECGSEPPACLERQSYTRLGID
ncbi:hypothetical protein FOL47_008322 [Perkinsus chesapeaki]|uniref:DNA-directed RNA polymerase III subunit RPC5 n=1 Tax=Perkinsus chesapeaki TaxID=330153 RepID=A0A7J6LEQ3_PERCH|nr:hypothetical protein FOL47_008322 [Perkinsus chesapeaki]